MSTVRNHEELAAWQRCRELEDLIAEIIARPRVAKHVNFCNQIERAARSAPSNVAEGLGRYQPRDNARFVRNALGSLHETQSLVREALTKKYIDKLEFTKLSTALRRAIGTNVKWHTYLKKCSPRPPEPETE